jgi:ComF family protein
MGWFRLLREMVLESLYPSAANCMGCGSPAGADEGWLCADCARLLKPLNALPGPRCPRCGRPSDGVARAGRCETCGDWPEGLVSAARFPYAYRRPLSGMIRRMKYQGVARMADWMAGEMLGTAERELPGGYDLIVPVPMHKKRLRLRGLNHAAALADAISRRTGVPSAEALWRTVDTPQQARQSAAARRKNLEGAFAASPSVTGRRVLLVDDVVTTGATALACARALRLAGACDVIFLALAGAIDRNLSHKKQNNGAKR